MSQPGLCPNLLRAQLSDPGLRARAQALSISSHNHSNTSHTNANGCLFDDWANTGLNKETDPNEANCVNRIALVVTKV